MRELEPFGRYRRLAAGIVTLAAVFGVSGSLAGASAATLPPGCSQSGQIVSCTQTFTSGSNPFTVPAGVTSIHVIANGGNGAGTGEQTVTTCPAPNGGVGGLGATVSGDLPVTGGSTLYAVVGANGGGQTIGGAGGGSGGVGGGGTSGAGGFPGGGASDVRTSPGDLTTRLLVAAGGGGAGGDTQYTFTGIPGAAAFQGGSGGDGSGSNGLGGTTIGTIGIGGCGGDGATTTAGGAGGLFFQIGLGETPAAAGGLGVGGAGGTGSFLSTSSETNAGGGGGGGGGGLYGGGGGGGELGAGGGGGGGSNLVPSGGTASIDTTGVPMVEISYKLVPTSMSQCMNSGWRNYPQFTSLGECVRFVETGK